MQNKGLKDLDNYYRNLPVEDLVHHIVQNNEGRVGLRGAAMVDTGIYTGRSPNDKYFVDESSSSDKIWWGSVNKKIDEEILNASPEFLEKVQKYDQENQLNYSTIYEIYSTIVNSEKTVHAKSKSK